MTSRTRSLVTAVAVCAVVVLAVGATAAAWHARRAPDGAGASLSAASAATITATDTDDRARAFLQRYVDDTGRVVRLDQAGDTVSEGQAYALLVALGLHDESTFLRIWTWTRDNLQRPDGLLSWHWQGGSVADPQAASDADLDAARALVLAGSAFGRSGLTSAGKRLGTAVLDHETVTYADGRLLLPGPWAPRTSPYLVDPSYFSPVSTRVLYRATGDARWLRLEAGGRAVLSRLTGSGRLVPDWATVSSGGAVRPATGPSGEPVVFGFEAARSPLRQTESCVRADRTIAAAQRAVLARDTQARAIDDLSGQPLVGYSTALSWATRAAADAASGRVAEAGRALTAADDLARQYPTYYGDAWNVLARLMLTGRALGGCPTGAGS